MKTLGAIQAFDYGSETCGEDIRRSSQNRIAHVFDCISEGRSGAHCAAAIGNNVHQPKYSALLPVQDFPRADVETAVTWAYTCIGEAYEMQDIAQIPASPEDHAFGIRFWKLARELFAQGKIQAHPIEEKSGRLTGVLNGLNEMREGKIRASKWVYRID